MRVTHPCGFPAGVTPDLPHPSHRREGLNWPFRNAVTRTAARSGSARLGLPITRVTTPGSPTSRRVPYKTKRNGLGDRESGAKTPPGSPMRRQH